MGRGPVDLFAGGERTEGLDRNTAPPAPRAARADVTLNKGRLSHSHIKPALNSHYRKLNYFSCFFNKIVLTLDDWLDDVLGLVLLS